MSKVSLAESVTFNESLGEKSWQSTWRMSVSGNNIIIRGYSPHEEIDVTCDSDMRTQRMSLKRRAEKTDIQVYRQDNELILSGQVKGQSLKRKWTIDALPWIQLPGVQSESFIQSDQHTRQFWILVTDTLKVEKIVLKKQNIESITLSGVQESAQSVRMTLPDWRSIFWSATLWFRLDTGQFLKYMGRTAKSGEQEFIMERVMKVP